MKPKTAEEFCTNIADLMNRGIFHDAENVLEAYLLQESAPLIKSLEGVKIYVEESGMLEDDSLMGGHLLTIANQGLSDFQKKHGGE